jgi:hypothetical protein
VLILCREREIELVDLQGRAYRIPVDTVKPAEGRSERFMDILEQYLVYIFTSGCPESGVRQAHVAYSTGAGTAAVGRNWLFPCRNAEKYIGSRKRAQGYFTDGGLSHANQKDRGLAADRRSFVAPAADRASDGAFREAAQRQDHRAGSGSQRLD